MAHDSYGGCGAMNFSLAAIRDDYTFVLVAERMLENEVRHTIDSTIAIFLGLIVGPAWT